jgi:hypothetical protein
MRILAVLAIAACHHAPKLCAPWDDLGLQPSSVGYCDKDHADIDFPHELGDGAQLVANTTKIVEQHGFHVVHVAKADPKVSVLRRDRDGLQLELRAHVLSGLDLNVDHRAFFEGNPEDIRRGVEILRGTFESLAPAFPRKLRGERRCDEAELSRLEPMLAKREVQIFDVAEVETGKSSPWLGSNIPAIPDADDYASLVGYRDSFRELASQRIVVGYRVTRVEEPQEGTSGPIDTSHGGRVRHGTFTPGLFAADLVVFDLHEARALCWTHVVATNSSSVETAYSKYPNASLALREDLRASIVKEVAAQLARLSKSLRVANVT